MNGRWEVTLVGGAYDGWKGEPEEVDADDVPRVAIAYRCEGVVGCPGHVTLDPLHPDIPLLTAVAYRRKTRDRGERAAVYECGDPKPASDLVGATPEHTTA